MGMTIIRVVWMIGLHSVLHGIFGIFHITTSYYVNYNLVLIHSFTVCNIILVVLGFTIFCVIIWRRPICCRIFGALFILLALVYFLVGLIYFLNYLPFYANSVFDSFCYYTDVECWVGPDYMASFWHVLTFLLLVTTLLWIVYGILLCKLAPCVCCIPCPPPPCKKLLERGACQPPTCCRQRRPRWYNKLFRSRCGQSSCFPTPTCPAPPPQPCSNPCSPPPPPPPSHPHQTCGQDCAPQTTPCPTFQAQPAPCSPCPKKGPKFVLTLRPGRLTEPDVVQLDSDKERNLRFDLISKPSIFPRDIFGQFSDDRFDAGCKARGQYRSIVDWTGSGSSEPATIFLPHAITSLLPSPGLSKVLEVTFVSPTSIVIGDVSLPIRKKEKKEITPS